MHLRAILLIFSFLTILNIANVEASEPTEFVVVVPSYNNEKWAIQNLESIVNQTYPYWSLYYINDCSSDRTGEFVDAFVQE